MAKTPEGIFQEDVIELAELLGWRVWHVYDSRRQKVEGMPDLILVRERVVWAELKGPRTRVEPIQVEVLDQLRATGAEVYLWRPKDWDEVVAVLSGTWEAAAA